MSGSRVLIPVAMVVLGAVVGVFAYQFWADRQALENGPAQAASIEELASSIESSVTASVGQKMEAYLDELKSEAPVAGADGISTEELTTAIVARLEQAMATGEIKLASAPQTGELAADASAPTADMGQTDVAAVEYPSRKAPMALPAERELQQIHFLHDSADLTPGAERKARLAAAAIVEEQPSRVQVQGFSDTMGSSGYNETLSQRRAASVAELLVAAGVPADVIEIRGMGDSALPEPTADSVREPLNRCVAITAIR